MKPSLKTDQLNQALEETVRRLEAERDRLRGLLYNGHFMDGGDTRVLSQFTDRLKTQDTFIIHPNELLGDALDRLDKKWELTGQATSRPSRPATTRAHRQED